MSIQCSVARLNNETQPVKSLRRNNLSLSQLKKVYEGHGAFSADLDWYIESGRSHQSLNMFKSCLVKHGLKLFSLKKLLTDVVLL